MVDGGTTISIGSNTFMIPLAGGHSGARTGGGCPDEEKTRKSNYERGLTDLSAFNQTGPQPTIKENQAAAVSPRSLGVTGKPNFPSFIVNPISF